MSIEHLKADLIETIHFLHAKGWAPATTSNYSFRVPAKQNPFADRFEQVYVISQTSIDKGKIHAGNLMYIDAKGNCIYPEGAKPSAETLLHTLLYENPKVGCVLHTHTVANTILSKKYKFDGYLEFDGYEIVKALAGNTTHEDVEVLPIFPNSQDIESLANDIRPYLAEEPKTHGFLLSGHGLYAWGATIAEAKRHIEVFEFLLECRLKELLLGDE